MSNNVNSEDTLNSSNPSISNKSRSSIDHGFKTPSMGLYGEAGKVVQAAAESIPQLMLVWMNERNAPELLPYERTLVEPLIDAIEKQAEYIMDKVDDKLMIMIFQTEIERIKYLIKSYLRTRLFKMEKYSLYILRRPDLQELLSSQEIIYVRRYQELIESHNHNSFLHQIPLSQHRQDEKSGDMNMVVEPNFEAAVFCKALITVGEIDLVRRTMIHTVLFEKDDIIFVRYRDIRQLLLEKKVRLI
ncbi:uncharacterized protein EV154DRAFT_503244 [Mucor mucedo]|uniref:uncharacterized protein n=1 Tax=Mucor mucedo TaxID=29922 RepID=UPI002220F8E5|nr:uncharacterized protein EV154DRAFT_503244 [Mucor mucedo]KAI7892872.1 hypothetical protein EV154DRAFT_503244 [Mucor mucedo]